LITILFLEIKLAEDQSPQEQIKVASNLDLQEKDLNKHSKHHKIKHQNP